MIVLLSVISIVLAVITLFLLLGLYNRKDKGPDDVLSDKLVTYERNLKDEFAQNRKEMSEANRASRTDTTAALMAFQAAVNNKLDALTKTSHDSFLKQQEAVTTGLAKVMETVSGNLKHIQESNEKKLEEMRVTVDEKLQSTLEKRLTSSFELVTKQLEAVQKGLGEMQTLANDVGGLKRALTNIKTAGGMGEVQLEALLSQFLSPEQFEKNAHPNPANTRLVVEFAVKIPDKGNASEYIYLPVDSKYPAAVWDKLTKAYEEADKEEIETQRKALRADIRNMAKDIKEKYIEAPYTTDFALMFVPFEGLFAEILRIPGLFQEIQTEFKVNIAGPTSLTAFLNSLQMGFRTLAIQKQTSKIWELLDTVKSEFGKYNELIAGVKKKLESGITEIEKVETRTRVIERNLKKLDKLPEPQQEPFLLSEE